MAVGSALLLLATTSGRAALTWDADAITTGAQTDGGGAWLGANQWWDGALNTAWVSGSDAVFGNGGAGGAVTLASATTAQSLAFNPFTGTYTLGTTASILTINGGITMNAGAGAVNLVSAITLGGAQSWTNSSTSTLSITNAAAAAIVYGDNLLTLSGGAFNFALTGSATTTGAGGVKISGGSVITNSSTVNPFGTGTLELNSGSIVNSTTNTNRTISNPVSLTGDFTFGAGGATGTNTFTGAVTTTGARSLMINTAQAIFNNASAFSLGGNLTVLGSGGIAITGAGGITGTGNITISTTGAIASTLGTGPINTTGTITNNGTGTGTTTISGVIASTVSAITQNSATSTLALSGANASYAGTTTLTAGTLIGSGTASNTLSALGTSEIILNGGTLQLRSNGGGNGGQTIVAGNNVTVGSNPATINVNNNGANTQNTIALGNLSIGTGQLNVTGTAGNLYSLRFTGPTTLTGNATINVSGAGLALPGVISGDGFGLTKLGSAASGAVAPVLGNLTVSGANTYTGVTAVYEGILTLNGDAPSGAAGTLGNATSAVLLGNTTGSANAYLLANNFVVGRDITVQSGNTGIAYLGSSSTSNTGSTTYSGAINLGSAGGAGHNLTLVSGAFHTVTYSGVIQDPAGLVGTAGVLTIGETTTANALTGTFSVNPSNGSTNIVLSGANTYSGGTILDTAATFRIGNVNALGTGYVSLLRGTITQGSGVGPLTGVSGITLDGTVTLNSFSFGAVGPVNLGTVPIFLPANRILNVVNNTSTVSGVISGAGRSLQLNGGNSANQALNMNGASTFDGGLIVAGATGFDLTAVSGNAAGFGAGPVILTNSVHSKASLNADTTVASLTSGITHTATFTGGTSALAAGTYPLTISGGGGSGAAGTATVNATGVVTAVSITNVGVNYTGSPTITLGSSTATFTPAAFGSSAFNLGARVLTIAGANASPATYVGVISGTGGLVKTGPGVQILTGASTFTGGVVIDGTGANSSLQAGHASALGTGQTRLTSSANARLNLLTDLSVSSLSSAIAAPTIASGGSGYLPESTFVLVSGGGGTGATATATVVGGAIIGITITNYGSNYTSAPTYEIFGDGANATVNGNFAASSVALNAQSLTFTGTNALPASYSGVISGTGGLIKNGQGTQTLTGANTFSGGTLINGTSPFVASIQTDNVSALGSGPVRLVSSNNAQLGLVSDLTVGSLSSAIDAPLIFFGGSGYVQGTTTVTVSGGGGSGATASAIVTNGAITGITITNRGNNYTSAPTFTIGGEGADADVAGNFGASGINLNIANLTIAGTNASPATFSGAITGAGNVNKDGAGTQILTGTSDYTGSTTVTAGTLVVSGPLVNTLQVGIGGGTFALGASDVVNDAATLVMLGGKFSSGGFSETMSTALILNTVTFDLGAGASVLHFANSSAESWSGILNITNWTGQTTGGGTDEVFFGSDASGLTGAEVAMIKFIDPAGFAPGTYNAQILASGEVVAVVPEPSSFLALAGGLGTLLAIRRSSSRRE